MTALTDQFLRLLESPGHATADDVSSIMPLTATVADVRTLHDIVNSLRTSSPFIHDVRPLSRAEVASLAPDPSGIGGQVDAVLVETRICIRGEVFVTTRPDGKLGGVRMRVIEPSVSSPADLRRQLQRLDPSVAVAVRAPGVDVSDTHPKAVSSLVKVFVLEAVLRAVDDCSMGLEESHAVDIRFVDERSAGLGHQHVGARVTTAELCRLMMLRSDNTSMDMLLECVGREAVLRVMDECGADPDLNRPLRSMRETIRAGSSTTRHETDRCSGPTLATTLDPAVTSPKHQAGYDYYVPLGSVGRAFDLVARHDWSPYPPSGTHGNQLAYKGGSAPGVLSAAWYRGVPGAASWLAFAVSSAEPLGSLEELHAITCAESLMGHLQMSAVADREMAAGGSR